MQRPFFKLSEMKGVLEFVKKNMGLIIPLGVVVFLLTIGRKMFTKGGVFGSESFLSDLAGGETPGEADKGRASKSVIERIGYDSARLSKSEVALNQATEDLYNAMVGLTTDEETIFKLLSPLRKDDLLYIIMRFGVRKDKIWGLTTFNGNLFEWFRAELSDSDLAKVGNVFRITAVWPY